MHPLVIAALVLVAVWVLAVLDLIPEFLPGIGGIDDAVVAALILRHLVRRAGVEVVRGSTGKGDTQTIGPILRVSGAEGTRPASS